MAETVQSSKRPRMAVPERLACSACDSKFFDVCGNRDNAVRLNQVFLDSLAVEISGCDPLAAASLRFCPICLLKLNELDSLMTELENLQIKIQNMKDFMCATVTNAAFQAKNGSGNGNPNSFLTTIRDQVLQSWAAFTKHGGAEARNGKDESNKSSSDFEIRGQNGLEIFDRLEQEIEGDDVDYLDTAASDNDYVTIVEDAEGSSTRATVDIKIDPDSWDATNSEEAYHSNSNSTDACFIDEVEERRKGNAKNGARPLSTILNPNNAIESMFYDESESDSSTYVFSATEIVPSTSSNRGSSALGPSRTAAGHQSNSVSIYSSNNASMGSGLLPVKTSLSRVPSILKSSAGRPSMKKHTKIEIEMCTLCFKYIASGVKHSCGEKSTTTMYQCAYCNAVFHSERVLNEHVRRHIPVYTDDRPMIPNVKPVHICKHCGKQFSSSSKLSLHFKRDHTKSGSDIIYCKLCPKTFKDSSLFRIHMIAHLKNPNSLRFRRNSMGDDKVLMSQNGSQLFSSSLRGETRNPVVMEENSDSL